MAGLVPAIHDFDERPALVARGPRVKTEDCAFAAQTLASPIYRDDAVNRYSVFRRPGGFSEEPVPDPIPNSAVKLLSANGSSS